MKTDAELEIRPMHETDFGAVLDVTNTAFIDQVETMYGRSAQNRSSRT